MRYCNVIVALALAVGLVAAAFIYVQARVLGEVGGRVARYSLIYARNLGKVIILDTMTGKTWVVQAPR